MGQAFDRFSMALAEGTSRRTALAGLLASAAAALPWTAEAKKNRRRRRRRRKERQKKKRFAQLQEFCRQWCGEKFGLAGNAFNTCVDKAKEGKGPCYSSTDQGPGYFCSQVLECIEECCPDTNTGGNPVTDGECCLDGESCTFLNATNFCTSPA